MGIQKFFKQADINQGVYEYLRRRDAKLLDVRSPAEYIQGHIPGSMNIPLHSLEDLEYLVENKTLPLYLYCQTGARSRMAAMQLKDMGYENVYNIGGIATYEGTVEC